MWQHPPEVPKALAPRRGGPQEAQPGAKARLREREKGGEWARGREKITGDAEQLGRPRRPRRRDQAAGWSVLELSIMANLQSSEILYEVRGESLERGSKRRP